MNVKQYASTLLAAMFLITVVPVSAVAAGPDNETVGGKPPGAGSGPSSIGGKVANGAAKGMGNLERVMNKLQELGQNTSDIEALANQARERIQAMNGSDNRTQVREMTQELRQLWAQIREKTQEQRKSAVQDKMGKAIGRAKGLFNNLDSMISKLKEKGVDTADLEETVSEIKAALSEAEGKYGESISEAAKLLKTVREKFNEFKHELRESVRGNRDKITGKPEGEEEEEEEGNETVQ